MLVGVGVFCGGQSLSVCNRQGCFMLEAVSCWKQLCLFVSQAIEPLFGRAVTPMVGKR